MSNSSSSSRLTRENTLLFLNLSISSYLGETLRVFLGNLFGTACQEPGTVGWNANEWTPCTTAPGTTLATGGALFSDLPSNMLGCFLTGMLFERVGRKMPCGGLQSNQFQTCHLRFSLQTGFCGALTTFSSWNTQMVVMICAGTGTQLSSSQWVSSIFGYLIGYMVAMQSYVMGRDLALALHRYKNKEWAMEADLTTQAYNNCQYQPASNGGECNFDLNLTRQSHNNNNVPMVINRHLHNLEKRYLHNIYFESHNPHEKRHHDAKDTIDTMASDDTRHGALSSLCTNNADQEEDATRFGISQQLAPHVYLLKQWKTTTHEARHAVTRTTRDLHEMEYNILVQNQEPRPDLIDLAHNMGWAVDALLTWKEATTTTKQQEESPKTTTLWWLLVVAFTLYLSITSFLIWFAMNESDSDDISVTYRTFALSALLSPFGTYSRWQLSRLNSLESKKKLLKTYYTKWHWVPCGTLLANMIACVVSATMVAASLRINPQNHVTLSVVGAIDTGFTGSLSTVATLVQETVALTQFFPRRGWSYYYAVGTILLGCLLGIASYVWAVV